MDKTVCITCLKMEMYLLTSPCNTFSLKKNSSKIKIGRSLEILSLPTKLKTTGMVSQKKSTCLSPCFIIAIASQGIVLCPHFKSCVSASKWSTYFMLRTLTAMEYRKLVPLLLMYKNQSRRKLECVLNISFSPYLAQ